MSSNPRESESAIQLSIRPNSIHKRVRRLGMPHEGASSRGGYIPVGVMLSAIQDSDIHAAPDLGSVPSCSLNALIQQCCRRWFGHQRGLGLLTTNRNLVWTCIVWLDRQGSFQKLGPGIIVGNQFLEQQHEVGDVLSFNNCLHALQRRFDLHCIEILMAYIASNLGVRSWD